MKFRGLSPGKPKALPVIPEPIVPVPLFYRWLNNSEEAIIIRNGKGEEVGKTIQYTFIATIS